MASRLETVTQKIGERLRQLRTERGWSQADLANRLVMSQPRLSAIERGLRSLTAEQFLELLQIFNVPASDFLDAPRAGNAQLQNALARLGATHLRESADVLPSEAVREVGDLIREVLIAPDSPRLVTALAPVLVAHIDRLNFQSVRVQLGKLGLRRRFGWLAENTTVALRNEVEHPLPRARKLAYMRARIVLDEWLEQIRDQPFRQAKPDFLDREVRSDKTMEALLERRSDISQRWNIVTAIQVDDFVQALRASHVGD